MAVKRADVAATRRSHASANASPAPAATPLTAAMIGLSRPSMASATSPYSDSGVFWSVRVIAGCWGPEERSAPVQKPRPVPVSTTTRTASSAFAARSASRRAAAVARSAALSRSGRLNVIVHTPSRLSVRMSGALVIGQYSSPRSAPGEAGLAAFEKRLDTLSAIRGGIDDGERRAGELERALEVQIAGAVGEHLAELLGDRRTGLDHARQLHRLLL